MYVQHKRKTDHYHYYHEYSIIESYNRINYPSVCVVQASTSPISDQSTQQLDENLVSSINISWIVFV